MPHPRSHLIAVYCLLASAAVPGPAAALAAIDIAEVKHPGSVDFEKEIRPILRRSCLACHNRSRSENDLVLETPQTILKGGADGPAVVPGKSGESLLLKLAAHREDPAMPPKDNKSDAPNLTPQELGLIRLWIDQGAKGDVSGADGKINWQPLPPGVHPIYAATISTDGQIAAAGRANQVIVYHIPAKREVTRLTDPSLLQRGGYEKPGVAHLDLVQSLAFSPDGETLASGAFREVKLWRRVRNARKVELAGLEAAAKSLAVSRDGKWAAVGLDNGKIACCDLATGKLARMLVGHSAAATSLAFSGDGARLVSGSADQWLRVWNPADGSQVAGWETALPIAAVAWVNKDQWIATAGQDNQIRLWAATGDAKLVKELAGHSGPVTSLAAVAGEGAPLVSGSQDGTLRVWDVIVGSQARQLNHGGPVEAVAVRSDGQWLASLGVGNTVKLWNLATGQPAGELKGDFRAKLKADEAGRAVALARKAAEAYQRDLDAATKRKQAEEESGKKAEEALKAAADDLAKKNEAAKDEKATAERKLEDAKQTLERATQSIRKATEDVPLAVAAAQAAAERVKQREAAAAAAGQAATDTEKPWLAVAFSPDGSTLAAIGADRQVFTFDGDGGAPLDVFAGPGNALPLVAFDAANDPVIVVDQTVVVWNAHAGWRLERTIGSPDSGDALVDRVTALAFSRDGTRLATGGGEPSRAGELKIWDAATGSLLREIGEPHSDTILAVEFSHDDRYLATCAADRFLKVFDVQTGKFVRSFEGHTHQVLGLSWSADDRTLVTGGADKVLKVWDFTTGDQKRTIAGFGKEVTALRFVADTPNVVAACGDNADGIEIQSANAQFNTHLQVRTALGFSRQGESQSARASLLDVSFWGRSPQPTSASPLLSWECPLHLLVPLRAEAKSFSMNTLMPSSTAYSKCGARMAACVVKIATSP